MTPDTPSVIGTFDSIKAVLPLPAGLSVGKTTGIISGTPTVIYSGVPLVLMVYYCNDSVGVNLSITVNDRLPIITSVTTPWTGNYTRTSGTDTIDIRGTWLRHVDTAFFGGAYSVDTTAMTDSLIRCVAPMYVPGLTFVAVRNSAGSDTLQGAVTFAGLANPRVTSKTTGLDTAGGVDTVRLSAVFGLTGATVIIPDIEPPLVTVDGDTAAWFIAPAHAAGSVAVTLLASGEAFAFTLQYGTNGKRRRSLWMGFGFGF
jgi:hypothetical protein